MLNLIRLTRCHTCSEKQKIRIWRPSYYSMLIFYVWFLKIRCLFFVFTPWKFNLPLKVILAALSSVCCLRSRNFCPGVTRRWRGGRRERKCCGMAPPTIGGGGPTTPGSRGPPSGAGRLPGSGIRIFCKFHLHFYNLPWTFNVPIFSGGTPQQRPGPKPGQPRPGGHRQDKARQQAKEQR